MGGKVGYMVLDISGGIMLPVNVTCDKLEQSIKAVLPILVTSEGMVIEVNGVLPNASCPMLFNEEFALNVTVAKLELL